MITESQAADCTAPRDDEPEVLAVTTSSVCFQLVGDVGASKIARSDMGRFWRWLADGAKVYAVIGGAAAVGSVTGGGTTPPTVTLAGTPLFAGALRIDVNATDGTIAGSTFDVSVGGTTIETELAPDGASLVLGDTGLTATLAYPTRGAVTGNGTTPPVMTTAGAAPLVAGAIRIDVATTDGTLANTTFDWTDDGAGGETGISAVDGVLTLGGAGITCTFAAGTFNVDNYWTFTVTGYNANNYWTAASGGTADEAATSGATVPMVFSDGVAVDLALPTKLVEDFLADRIGCIWMAVKGAGATNLRFWPTSGKVDRAG